VSRFQRGFCCGRSRSGSEQGEQGEKTQRHSL
jgi:hypothetical protein